MRRTIFISVLMLLLGATSLCSAQTTQPSPEIQPAQPRTQRLMVISVDGLRPDMLLRCNTPNMHALFRSGSFTFWAQTTALATTLPSHTSMLTGVIPRRHEIEWNKDLPLKEPVYPRYPTLFEVAHKHGYSTAMAAGKSKFHTLAKPGTLDWFWVTESEKTQDPEVMDHALEIIKEHQPQVMFVHLPTDDNVGHASGWGTPEQEKAVEGADEQIGRLLTALNDTQLREQTVIILTADHGGAGLMHKPDDPRSRNIPWIITGPGIRKNFDLTKYLPLVINTEDTFVTSCYLLGIPTREDLDGKPIREVLEAPGELLH